MGHELASGNQGLKDSVMALKWVRDNIIDFGGDPKNITIAGNSAAGAIVHLLTISPMAKGIEQILFNIKQIYNFSCQGLFHRAIIQSGTAHNAWAMAKPKSYPGYELALSLGNNSRDPQDVVEFLQTIPAVKIIETFTKIFGLQVRISFSIHKHQIFIKAIVTCNIILFRIFLYSCQTLMIWQRFRFYPYQLKN